MKPEVKYEDKYLEKFKKFQNEFSFTEDELEQEQSEEYIKIRVEVLKKIDSILINSDSMFRLYKDK